MAAVADQQKSGPENRSPSAALTPTPGARWIPPKRASYYPVNVEETNIAGVRTDIITPLAMPEANRNRVLINLHGGGFNSDSGSLIEGDPDREPGEDQRSFRSTTASRRRIPSLPRSTMWSRSTKNFSRLTSRTASEFSERRRERF